MLPSRRDPKIQGEQAECAFLLQATRRGLVVSKPWGDTARYDFIVDNGSRLLRVQVKSVSRLDGRRYCIQCGYGRHGKRAYTPEQMDVLAAYIIPEDAWYLIPVRAFSPLKRIYLTPHEPARKGGFEKYRETWEVLEGRLCR